jgi:hypothetical protein
MFFRFVKREIRDYTVNFLLIIKPASGQRKDFFAIRALPTEGRVTNLARDY